MARMLSLRLVGLLGLSRAAAANHQKPLGDGHEESVFKANPFDDEFGKFANEAMQKWKVPGLSIAVVDNGDVYAEGYGFATLPDKPATPETLWYCASTTKAFTAATLAHLIDTKEFVALADGWSTTISSIIRDDFVLQDEWATEHITLDDAVSHRTGMPRHDMTSQRLINGRPGVPRDIVRNLRNLPLSAEARVKHQYCNHMYVMLSYIIETVTGNWLGDVFKSKIWGPLGMDSTYLDLDEALAAPNHLAQGYYWDKKDGKYHEVAHMSTTELSGAGGMFSNVLDYAKWIKSLLHKTGPLSEAAHEDVRTPRFIASMPVYGRDIQLYGLGWFRFVYRGHVVYTHSGNMHAFGAEVYWLPELKYGVVAFANTVVTSNLVSEVLIFKLIDAKLGVKEEDRIDAEKSWSDTIDQMTESMDNALDIAYPNRPDAPMPPTVSIDKLEGTYHNVGYQNLTLHAEPHAQDHTKKILTGFRANDTRPLAFYMHHVSGNWWIWYAVTPRNPSISFWQFARAEFKIGVDGEPAALDMEFDVLAEKEGGSVKVLFTKIS